MRIHNDIMNIQITVGRQIRAIEESIEPPGSGPSDIAIKAYARGHRDARHVAADLVLDLEAENERLQSKSDAQYLRYKRLLNGINAVITMADDPEKVSEIIKNSMKTKIKGGE